MKYTYHLFLLALAVLLGACDIANNKIEPGTVFSKIYENNNFDQGFFVQDIKQNPDGTYLILGEYTSPDALLPLLYLMQIDAEGNFMWEHLSTEYANPVSEMMLINGEYHFVCMNATNPQTRLVRAAQEPSLVESFDQIEIPLAAALTNDGRVIVSGFNPLSRSTRVFLQGEGSAWVFDNFEDVDGIVNEHLTKQRKPLPFAVGSLPNGYFFNGFRNFNLSLNFLDNTGARTGTINGERYNAAVSAFLPLEGNRAAVARYNSAGLTSFNAAAVFNATTDISDPNSIIGNNLPELLPNARVVVKTAVLRQRPVVLYLSETRNGQLVLFIYDQQSGILISNRYLGANNSFEAGGMTLTQDGGLAIVGRVFIAGRFPRVCVFKLEKDDLERDIP